MTHGSLFSGIGGFDLAAEWMGWENKFHCEWNEFGQKVLKYYWPNSESFSDITKTDFTKYANKIDILTGGFPCQPYSQAGGNAIVPQVVYQIFKAIEQYETL
jgi:DNA (cytosine-5)-methyltransferase 1